MPITQDQILEIVSAAEATHKSLQTVISATKNIIDVEMPAIRKRVETQPQPDYNQMLSEIRSLGTLIQDLTNIGYQELYNLSEHTRVVARWRDHYKLRYKSNINSRRWNEERRQQRRQGTEPTPEIEIEIPFNKTQTTAAEIEERLLQGVLPNDEWHVYPGGKPPQSNEGLWDDFVRYIRIGLRWHEIKGQTWTTVSFQVGNIPQTKTFAEAIDGIEPEKLTWKGNQS